MNIGQKLAYTRDFAEGLEDSVELVLTEPQSALLVELTGTFTATGAAGAGALRSDAAYRMLRRAQLSANNRPIVTVDGRFTRVLQTMLERELWPQTPPTSVADTTSQAIRLYYVIPGRMPHSLVGEEFGIVPRAGVKYTLGLQWGNASDMVNAAENVLAITGGRVRIYELPYQGTAGASFAPLLIQRFEKDVVQSGEIEIEMPTIGPRMEVRAVFLEGLAGGSNGFDYEHNDSVITSLKTFEIDGEEKWKATDREVIQARNVKEYGLDAIETGVLVIDAAENQRTEVGELYTVRSLRPKVRLEVAKQAGNNKVVAHVIATAGRI